MTGRPKSGKRGGGGSAAKRAVDAIEKKYGVAARKSAQSGGRKPAAWTEDSRRPPSAGARRETNAPTGAQSAEARVSDDLSVAVARPLEASVSEVFRAFNDPSRRGWNAGRDYVVRSTIAPRLLRLRLPDDTLVAVTIERKGNARCTVTVEHNNLSDERAAEQAKAHWREALARLSALLAE